MEGREYVKILFLINHYSSELPRPRGVNVYKRRLASSPGRSCSVFWYICPGTSGKDCYHRNKPNRVTIVAVKAWASQTLHQKKSDILHQRKSYDSEETCFRIHSTVSILALSKGSNSANFHDWEISSSPGTEMW